MLKSSGLPFIEFSEVVAKAGRGIASKQGDPMWMTPEEINRRALGYLIPRGIYPKRGKNGEIKGVELIDGLKSKYQQSKMEFEMFDKFDKKWTQLPDGSWRRVLDDTELNLGEIEYK
jgi:hypothetical protein